MSLPCGQPQAAGDPYARQRLIDGWDQPTLTAATAVILGLGALGNEVAKNLALAGVGRLILCDPDVVEASNLSRMVLFSPDDIRRPKVEAAADAISRMGGITRIETRQATLTAGVGLGELAAASVVLGCLDSRRSRLELLSRCALVGAVLVDGGTGPWIGEVRIRRSTEEPCYACSLSPFERGEADMPRSCAEAQPPGAQPASIATTAVTAGWMTTIVLRLLLGQPLSYRMLRIDAVLGTTAPVGLVRDPDCPHHKPLPAVDAVLPLSHLDRVSSLLRVLPAGSDPLSWSAFPVTAPCLHCGHKSGYDDSGGADRPALARCAKCGAVRRLQSSYRLAEANHWSRLADMGVAPQEILTVRTGGGKHLWMQLSA